MKIFALLLVAMTFVGCTPTWKKTPAPDIHGTNSLASAMSFITTNGWNTYADFRLVIPVYMASRKIKKGFQEMQSKMQDHMQQQQQGYTTQPSAPEPEPKRKAGDYIDFEEVK